MPPDLMLRYVSLLTWWARTNHTQLRSTFVNEHDVYYNYSPKYRHNYAMALNVVEKFARKHQLLPRINGQRGKLLSSYEQRLTEPMKTIYRRDKKTKMVSSKSWILSMKMTYLAQRINNLIHV